MKSLILAAGYATRLYPLTQSKPKPLLDIGGKPVLEYILGHIEKIDGVDDATLVVNHKFYSQFEKWKKSYRSSKPLVLLDDGSTHEGNRLGAIGDMRFTIRERKVRSDLLVVAGDNLFDIDLRPFVQSAQKKSPFSSVMLYDVKDFSLARQYGIVGLDGESRIVSFEEKPEHPQSTLSAMGVYYFPKEVLGQIDTYLQGGSPQDAPGFFLRWLSQKETVYGYPSTGTWYDIGDLASYQKAAGAFKKEVNT
ncbi:MAG: nucleotidyltransferase family protein [Candidatus Omnitrophica bacterium]|nr:nucleotidyltransferase family protein [Candidatus Omnitrophota bacterium]